MADDTLKLSHYRNVRSAALQQAARDRHVGLMPSSIQIRKDGDLLWGLFRREHPTSFTSRDVDEFVSGWDAALVHAKEA